MNTNTNSKDITLPPQEIDPIPALILCLGIGAIITGYSLTYQLHQLIGPRAWLMDGPALAVLTVLSIAAFALVNINRWLTLLCLITVALCLLILGGAA